MEVHLHGLPEFLADGALKKRLDPVMAKLGIPDDAFECEKYKKQKWANITFREHVHGQIFLASHGEQPLSTPIQQPGRRYSNASSARASANGSIFTSLGSTGPNRRPRRQARLQLAGNDVFCSLSKNSKDPRAVAGQPNPITLRGLKYAAEEKANPTRNIEKESSPDIFDLVSLSCGHNVLDGDKLVFIPEVEFQDTGLAKFTKRTLLIKLNGGRVIKVPLETIVSLVCSFDHTLTMTLTQEPSFFSENGPTFNSNEMGELLQKLMSISLADLSLNSEPTRTRICSLDEQHAKVVGQCLVYQFQVSGADLHKRMQVLKNHDVVPFVRYRVMTQRTPPLALGSSRQAMDVLMSELAANNQGNHLPFGILFQLQALAYNAYLHPGVVLALMRELRRKFRSDREASRRTISVDAMRKLFKEIDWPVPHGDPSHFEVDSIIRLLGKLDDEFRSNASLRSTALFGATQNLAAIYRVTVTPTRLTLHGPELEAKNRILRKFPNHHEYFLRVQFCDENGQDLFYNPKISYDAVWARFKHVLSTGIQVAGRTYSFLGFSHSSLRSHSAWFSAPFIDDDGKLQTYFSIIKALGTFSNIRCPARCAARIGQAFSETPFSVPLDEYGIQVLEIPDVMSPDGKRVFSDGVGTLTWDVIYNIWDVIPQKKAAPTAFQIRYRGTKGMLAVDSIRDGSVVCIRPSMTKFESQDKQVLEICDMASKPIPLVLNRQMIKILEDMGVEPSWFHEMQSMELTRLREVMADTYHVANFLKHKNVADGIRLHRLFQHAANMGMDWRKDSFLCSVVEAVVLRELRLLKHKARIPIEKGVTLFGIMDETGFLREGQVYITYDTMEGRFERPPGEGIVLVTRSPALHPGDVQIAQVVVPPVGHTLRDHMNVIVFSRHGARDLPSQLSGGDLDGDIYNVIWDQQAMPKKVFAPADYPRVSPMNLEREVTKEDMANFFIDFMKSDHLGVIASRHMILADQRDSGTNEPDCLKLAALHSTAVDYSKTGIPVDLRELPRAEKFRPDFLAPGPDVHIVDKSSIMLDNYILEPAADDDEDQFSGQRHRYYKSEKVLGHLYRAVDEKKIWKEDVKSKIRSQGASFWDEFLNAIRPRLESVVDDPGEWTSRLKTAREIRGWYEDAVSDAMNQYSEHPIKPISELEVFIGNIFNKSGVQTNRQRDNSIKLRDQFDRVCDWITGEMRRAAHDPDTLTGYETKHDNLHLCLACVHVGGEKGFGSGGASYANMQSFRVVAACALISELNRLEGGRRGGGFVGVRGRGATVAHKSKGAYSSVPPPTNGC